MTSKRPGRQGVPVLPAIMGVFLAAVLGVVVVQPWRFMSERSVAKSRSVAKALSSTKASEEYVTEAEVLVSRWARMGTPLLLHVEPPPSPDYMRGNLAVAVRLPGMQEPFAAWLVEDHFGREGGGIPVSQARVVEIPRSNLLTGKQRLQMATFRAAGYESLSYLNPGSCVPLEHLRERQTEWINVPIDVQRVDEAELREQLLEPERVKRAVLQGCVVIRRAQNDGGSGFIAMAQSLHFSVANTFPVARVNILRRQRPVAYFDIPGYIDPDYTWALWHEVHIVEGETLEDTSDLSAELVVSDAMREQTIDQAGSWVGRAPIATVKVLPGE